VNADHDIAAFRRRPEALRWAICFALALCFHAVGAAALMARWNDSTDLVANAPVIMIDLAAVAVAPATTPTELPPGPRPTEAQPESQPQQPVEKIEKVELPPAPKAELQITPPPKERPKDKKPKQKHVSLASAPSAAEHRGERPAAPAPGSNARYSDVLSDWKSLLIARLERAKRPPPETPNASGIARLAFSVDGSGGVHNARIVRSSGSGVIDRETLMLIQRAQPMPPPPPEVPASEREFEVPVRYNIR
jgi:protein TonB